MANREEELKKLKERYAQTRGAAPIKKKEPVKRIMPVRRSFKLPQINLKPYLHIIENDFRKLMGLPSIEEIKKRNTYDPLMAAWLRGR
ncbi:MAG: hypothetical protein WC433_07915 [Candidatus Omnitrophota bacterium]|jgi:hypothetical protein